VRPQQQWHDDDQADVHALAAAYGFGLVKNRPYTEGNERTGFWRW
jgi:death-on-curing protein